MSSTENSTQSTNDKVSCNVPEACKLYLQVVFRLSDKSCLRLYANCTCQALIRLRMRSLVRACAFLLNLRGSNSNCMGDLLHIQTRVHMCVVSVTSQRMNSARTKTCNKRTTMGRSVEKKVLGMELVVGKVGA